MSTLQKIKKPRSLPHKRGIGVLVHRRKPLLRESTKLLTVKKRSGSPVNNIEIMLDSTPVQMAWLDADLKYVRVNRAFARAFGKKQAFFTQKNHFTLFPDKDREQLFKQVMQSGKPLFTDAKSSSGDASPGRLKACYDWNLVPVRGRHNKPSGLVITLIDGTRGKIAESALRENQSQFRPVIESTRKAIESVYAIATTSSASLATQCDLIAAKIASLTATPVCFIFQIVKDRLELISLSNDGLLYHEGAVAVSQEPYAPVVREARVFQAAGHFPGVLDTCATTAGGRDFRAFLAVPVLDNAGKVTGILGVFDTRERLFSEYEVRLVEIFARYAAHEIERNSMELQLQHSREMAVLGRLASGVAHEVRNPLNGILSISEALFQDFGDVPEYRPYLFHIRAQTDRLTTLMQELLELGNPIRAVNMHRESLVPICKEALSLWQHSSPFAGRTIRFNAPNTPIDVLADSVKLQQVLTNLLENAAQSTGEDQGEIRVEIDQPRDHLVHLRVVDPGTGVPPENLNKVFEPFFTTRRKGYGLGLSIVKHIVECHAGEATLRNNANAPGCTAEIILPLYDKSHLAYNEISSPESFAMGNASNYIEP